METKILTAETISAIILSKKEHSPCTIAIQLPKGHEEIDLFQYCLTLFLECICCYTDDFRNLDVKQINEKTLTMFAPHMNVAHIILKVKEYKRDESEQFENYYCRIMLKSIEEGYFLIKKIPKNYHFMTSYKYQSVNESSLKLADLYAIFYTPSHAYKISFSICNHTHHQPSEKSILKNSTVMSNE